VTALSDRGVGPPVYGAASRDVPDTAAEAVDFDGFYHAHFRPLSVQLCAYVGDLHVAQDLVQEAFCRAYPRWRRVSGLDDPVGWVRKVAWNLATSRWRRTRTALVNQHRLRGWYAPVEGPTPDRVALTRALATLPENQRRVVVLHHLADLTVAEIARQERVAEGTVKSWLHRGRAGLARALAEEGER
jgi:RNA polymerase sigma-70 factor (ECF subfamily)